MTRGHGWRFLDVGRRIERGTNLVAVTRTMVAELPHVMHRYRSVPTFVFPFRRIFFPQIPHILLCFCMKSYNPMYDFRSTQTKELDGI